MKNQPDEDGDVALMTADAEDGLVPDGVPLLRPTAYNLPEGMSSAEVFDEEFSENLSELLAAIKNSDGNQTHFDRIEDGQLVDTIEPSLFLVDQFIDLETVNCLTSAWIP